MASAPLAGSSPREGAWAAKRLTFTLPPRS